MIYLLALSFSLPRVFHEPLTEHRFESRNRLTTDRPRLLALGSIIIRKDPKERRMITE